jgi:hypothetical protein
LPGGLLKDPEPPQGSGASSRIRSFLKDQELPQEPGAWRNF